VKESIRDKWGWLKAVLQGAGQPQESIAKAANVSQAAVSRVLDKCPRRQGSAFKKLCIYARNISLEPDRPHPATNESLMAALRETWDGSEEQAEALVGVLRAVDRVLRAKK